MKYYLAILIILFLFVAVSVRAQEASEGWAQILQEETCPSDMVKIKGDYCPNVEEICLYYVDSNGNKIPPGDMPGQTGRCGEFKYPTKCLSEHKIHKMFCIDKYEIPNIKGQIPTAWLSYNDAQKFCQAKNKRLCTDSEWTFSCEGINMKPYPYGDGYHRDKNACNFDNPVIGINVFKATSPKTSMAEHLNSMLVPSGSMEECKSDFGVYDQIGNLDEMVTNESGQPFSSGLKGGHIFGVRSRCRPMTTAHNEYFAWYEEGARCCGDLQ